MGVTLPNGPDATLPTPPRAPGGHIFRVGEILSESYQIRGCLGEGGMSQVFEAQDLALNRRVAIKASWPHPSGPTLRKEAQALAVLRHPNMAVVHALGRHRGIDYLVMERIYGVSLKEHLRRRGRLDGGETVEILAALAHTLDAVHRAGVVHRDVKPANVMLAPGNRIVLVDFGVFAAEFELGQDEPLAGTPQYMAPELIRRQVRPGAGHLVDVYALGVTGFELLTGRAPFDHGSAYDIMVSQLRAPLPDLRALRPDVPRPLAALIETMVAKDPEARPQSMEEVLAALRTVGRPPARLRILVVDDHGATLELLGHAIEHALPELEIVPCKSAEEAIAAVEKRAPDIITVDLEMPAMNGVELCLYLRGARLASDASLVVVSGHAQRPDVQLLGQLGVSHFIWKGGDYVTKVVGTIRELARQRQRAVR